jgi:hypothetical protein
MFEFPEWSNNLSNYYVGLRVGKRNKALRRMYYRKIEKEKLRLAELNICQDCILKNCRYLASLKGSSRCDACVSGFRQLSLCFKSI